MSKEYFCKVYNINGYYITTWDDASFSGFTKSINGGLGECSIKLARQFDNFGEGSDVTLGNEVQIWVSDNDSGSTGLKIYSGFISKYEPFLDGTSEGVTITLLGYVAHLARYPLIGAAGATSVSYSSQDCSAIMKGLIDNYRAFYPYSGGQRAGFHRINYTTGAGGSISANTGSVISYTFVNFTIYEALNKLRDIAPANWWWYIGADNLLKFEAKPSKPTHNFTLGKDFTKVAVKKNIEYVTNHIRFWNGLMTTDSTYLRTNYNDATSQNNYYLWLEKVTDGRILASATANYLGNSLLAEKKDPEIRTEIEIIDNNESGGWGYDIESINPGDTCTLLGFDNTSNTFESNMMITEVRYNLDSVTIVLANKQVEVGRQIQQLYAALDDTINTDAP